MLITLTLQQNKLEHFENMACDMHALDRRYTLAYYGYKLHMAQAK
jgi:hypothetical protein